MWLCVCVLMCPCVCAHQDFELDVELPGEGLEHVQVVAARGLEQHLKGLQAVVRHAVHWGRKQQRRVTVLSVGK